jgi:hypothetical protein
VGPRVMGEFVPVLIREWQKPFERLFTGPIPKGGNLLSREGNLFAWLIAGSSVGHSFNIG